MLLFRFFWFAAVVAGNVAVPASAAAALRISAAGAAAVAGVMNKLFQLIV